MVDHLILHIGPPKTGSKAIQTGFDSNRDRLKAQGVLYPTGVWHGQLGSWATNGRLDYTYNIWAQRQNRGDIKQADEAYIDNLCHELASYQGDAFISYEGFSVLSRQEFRKIRAQLKPHCRRMSVLVYLRHPVSWAVSTLSTRTLHGIPVEHPSELVRKFSKFVRNASSAFGAKHVVLREFDRRSLVHQDPFLDALSLLSEEMASEIARETSGSGPVNRALSLQAFQIAQHLQQELSLQSDRTRKRALNKFLRAVDGDKLTLTQRELDEVKQAALPELEFLHAKFGFEFSETDDIQPRNPDSGLSEKDSLAIANALKESFG